MIFAAIEKIQNGTVTINIRVALLEAETFEQAKEKYKAKMDQTLFTITSDTLDILSCRSTQHGLSVVGMLKNDPVNFIE